MRRGSRYWRLWGVHYNIAPSVHSMGEGNFQIKRYESSDVQDSNPSMHSCYFYDHREEKGGWVLFATKARRAPLTLR